MQYLFDRSDAAGVPPGAVSGAVAVGSRAGDADERRAAARALPPRSGGRCCREYGRRRWRASSSLASMLRRSGRPPAWGALRAGVRTSIDWLGSRGAWTDTGWPATLEGAVLSGHAAAREARGARRGRSGDSRETKGCRARVARRWERASQAHERATADRRADARRAGARGCGSRPDARAVDALASQTGEDGAIVIARTGMGPAHARSAAQTLAGAAGRALLVLGFCGGLDEIRSPAK